LAAQPAGQSKPLPPDVRLEVEIAAGFETGSEVIREIADAAPLGERGEERLRDREALLRSVVEGIPQLVWRAVDDGQWTWCSPQWTAFTGQPEITALGRGWLEPIHPDDRELVLGAWCMAQCCRQRPAGSSSSFAACGDQ
jgi:PAS domain-containing protein